MFKMKELWIGIIIGLLIGAILGFSFGTYRALDYCVTTGLSFLKANNIEIEINKNLIITGITMYKNNIGALTNCTST